MKPMLMITEMVKAISAGRTSLTRQLIKPQPYNVLYNGILQQGEIEDGEVLLTLNKDNITEMLIPPYQAGDVLYVRETWCKGSLNGGAEQYFYKADDNDFHCQWRPAIHMPKEAARIFLRVIGVRVERLQDITVNGILQEGIDFDIETPIASWRNFIDLWESTLKKPNIYKYGWDANPWVWVIEFERISKEEAMKNA